MSKVLKATCEAGKVKVFGEFETEATILSKGVGSSEGVVVVCEDQVYYVANRASDLETTLTKTIEAIQKIADVLTSIGAGMTGSTTAPPPTLAADVAEIDALAVELVTLKGGLK